jgi:hypothetical protein
MLLHELSRKFQMGKLKSSLLWLCFVLNWASVSISRVIQGMKQTYLVLWYPLSQVQWNKCDQQSPSLKLLSKRTSYIASFRFSWEASNICLTRIKEPVCGKIRTNVFLQKKCRLFVKTSLPNMCHNLFCVQYSTDCRDTFAIEISSRVMEDSSLHLCPRFPLS